jgi:uncharacterized protein
MNKTKTEGPQVRDGIPADSALNSDVLQRGVCKRVQLDPEITRLIEKANEHLGAIGYTEHGLRHANRVCNSAGMILEKLGYETHEVEMARVAGYLHDIGNFIGRTNHGQTGAAVLYTMLKRFELSFDDEAKVLSAVGNHEEQYGQVMNNTGAAVVIADKADVHRSRVRNYDPSKQDIHDHVNYAVTSSKLSVDTDKREIILDLIIDNQIASVMDYFNIFLQRMEMCQNAAKFLGCDFVLIANGARLS